MFFIVCRYDGQYRRNYERIVYNFVIERIFGELLIFFIEELDDVFNYQCNFMEYGLFYMNCIDVIVEGDGDRIMRCWKFLFFYFYLDSQSIKYVVEVFYF